MNVIMQAISHYMLRIKMTLTLYVSIELTNFVVAFYYAFVHDVIIIFRDYLRLTKRMNMHTKTRQNNM